MPPNFGHFRCALSNKNLSGKQPVTNTYLATCRSNATCTFAHPFLGLFPHFLLIHSPLLVTFKPDESRTITKSSGSSSTSGNSFNLNSSFDSL